MILESYDTYTWSGVGFFSQETQIDFEFEFKTQANFFNVAQFCFNPSIVYYPFELQGGTIKIIKIFHIILGFICRIELHTSCNCAFILDTLHNNSLRSHNLCQ